MVLIFCKILITFESFLGLFTFQLFWGSSIILAPLAPPLLSEPLYVDADAHAVDTRSEAEIFEFNNFDFKKLNINVRVICPGFIDTEATRKNSFKMPFLKSAEYAGKKIFERLTKGKEFEIIFPYLIVYFFKFTRILPYKIYFYIWKKLGNF